MTDALQKVGVWVVIGSTRHRGDLTTSEAVRETSLRWSGCTANAASFADVFGGDIAIRIAMVEGPRLAEPLKAVGGVISAEPALADPELNQASVRLCC
jgi:hypothetical protein